MSLSVYIYVTAKGSTNSFRFVRRPVLPHAGPLRRGGFPGGWSTGVNDFQVLKKDLRVDSPYRNLCLAEPC
jgi:hypothetical protein